MAILTCKSFKNGYSKIYGIVTPMTLSGKQMEPKKMLFEMDIIKNTNFENLIFKRRVDCNKNTQSLNWSIVNNKLAYLGSPINYQDADLTIHRQSFNIIKPGSCTISEDPGFSINLFSSDSDENAELLFEIE